MSNFELRDDVSIACDKRAVWHLLTLARQGEIKEQTKNTIGALLIFIGVLLAVLGVLLWGY